MSINCLSFSLYGTNKKYLSGAVKNVALARKWFPNYQCYFFVDQTVPQTVLHQLQGDNVKIVDMTDSTIPPPMWRFTAIDNPEVNLMRSCDTDSRLDEREQMLMENWLKDGTDFLVTKDHPYGHLGFPIFAGMWAMRKLTNINMTLLINKWVATKTESELSKYGSDQLFLKEVMYPLMVNNISYYDDFNINKWEAKKIPHSRNNWHFVGEVFDENDCRGRQWKSLRGYTLREKGLVGYLAAKVLNVFNPEWN